MLPPETGDLAGTDPCRQAPDLIELRTGLRIHEDVLAWFRAQSRGYQTRMNAVLRAYVEAHKREGR